MDNRVELNTTKYIHKCTVSFVCLAMTYSELRVAFSRDELQDIGRMKDVTIAEIAVNHCHPASHSFASIFVPVAIRTNNQCASSHRATFKNNNLHIYITH